MSVMASSLAMLPAAGLRPLRLLGSGTAGALDAVTSAALDARLGLPPGSVEKRSGVQVRGVETRRSAAELGAAAAREALAAAALDLTDVDLLMAASATMDQAMPCNAALIHRELGAAARGLPAFDVGASCLGFLVALDTATALIAAGRYRRVLIVAADIASCGLDWDHLEASAIFGDGAAAFVIDGGGSGAAPSAGLLAAAFATYSEGAHFCEIRGGGSRYHPSRIHEPFAPLARFRMDGQAVFRLAAHHLGDFIDALLARAGLERQAIDLVVPHQASRHGLDFLRRLLRFPAARLVDIFATHGNQVAASLPSALHAARADGRLQAGMNVLLIGTGAGVSFGGLVLRS
ncbi:3-oxoacyl-[acyl-carrier-protein] synthase III C-terminal domain-containing protein [Tahibacter sp. UC22_41]|uniref:3-oxoacyl-[acyl-carrier-protein] synthase III C-terminal domain-containing protein n=1 Tax=Tahibacter sp. UC22_41 TaxID=3350178 RepID=UPI0036D7A420